MIYFQGKVDFNNDLFPMERRDFMTNIVTFQELFQFVLVLIAVANFASFDRKKK